MDQAKLFRIRLGPDKKIIGPGEKVQDQVGTRRNSLGLDYDLVKMRLETGETVYD